MQIGFLASLPHAFNVCLQRFCGRSTWRRHTVTSTWVSTAWRKRRGPAGSPRDTRHQRRRSFTGKKAKRDPLSRWPVALSKVIHYLKAAWINQTGGFLIVLEGQRDAIESAALPPKTRHLPPFVSFRSQISFITSGPPAAAVHLTVGCKPQRIPSPPCEQRWAVIHYLVYPQLQWNYCLSNM